MMKIGLDVGSTTIKCVVLDENEQICFESYEDTILKSLRKWRLY
ncbi:MAG: hypothetical protein ACLSCV_09230 [Acutalibacteraceae bacterium]